MKHFPKKILLIDREAGITRLVRQALERAGKYLVQEEHNAQVALETAHSFQPDLILLDAAPNSLDGQTLERQIHADIQLRDTPMVRLSNLKSESQVMSGGILSGYSFFAAPVRIEEVLRGIDELLDVARRYIATRVRIVHVAGKSSDPRDVGIYFWRKRVLDVLINAVRNASDAGVRPIPIAGMPGSSEATPTSRQRRCANVWTPRTPRCSTCS